MPAKQCYDPYRATQVVSSSASVPCIVPVSIPDSFVSSPLPHDCGDLSPDNSNKFDTLSLCIVSQGGGGETTPTSPSAQFSQDNIFPPGGPEPIPSRENSANTKLGHGGDEEHSKILPTHGKGSSVRSYAADGSSVGGVPCGAIQDPPGKPMTWSTEVGSSCVTTGSCFSEKQEINPSQSVLNQFSSESESGLKNQQLESESLLVHLSVVSSNLLIS